MRFVRMPVSSRALTSICRRLIYRILIRVVLSLPLSVHIQASHVIWPRLYLTLCLLSPQGHS